MKYVMLLWPHANVRYQAETVRLAQAELALMLARVAPAASATPAPLLEMPALTLETPASLDVPALAAIARHSLLYCLFAAGKDGDLQPVLGRAPACLGADLPGILKYKGKTNELFLQLLINASLYAGDLWPRQAEPLSFYDPMCGRATALFEAVNRGWNATGTDIDRSDLGEAEKFFKRYLEYHRFKHSAERGALTLKGEKPAPVSGFSFASTPEAYRAGETQSLRLVHMDACRARDAFGRNKFHVIAADLPYGVQHKSGGGIEGLLARALSAWRETLAPGGAVALSFNCLTLKTARVRQLLAEAGFEVAEGGPWDGFEHWVEQAVTRDLAVGVKR